MSSLKKGTPLYLFLITCAVIIAVLLTSTFAWFVMNRQVTVSSASDKNLAVAINAGDLEIAISYQIATIGDEHYGEFSEYSEFGDNLEMSIPTPQFMDVTGNGKSLWFPSYLDANDQPDYRLESAWSDVTNNMNYVMTLHLKFRTAQAMDVYLDERSFVEGVEALTGVDITRSSSISNYQFSQDAICGCVRAAFLEPDVEGNETLKMVWIPNDNLRIHYEDSTAILETDVQTHAENKYFIKYAGTMVDYVYGITADPTKDWDDSSYANGKVTVGKEGLASVTPSGETVANFGAPLLSFEAQGEMQTKDLTVRIWFEGTDNEADKACDGGMVRYGFGFSGVNKKAASAEAMQAIQGIQCYQTGGHFQLHWSNNIECGQPFTPAGSDTSVEVLYSYDCIDWSPVGIGLQIDSTKPFVYVRSKETADSLSSEIRTILVAGSAQGDVPTRP